MKQRFFNDNGVWYQECPGYYYEGETTYLIASCPAIDRQRGHKPEEEGSIPGAGYDQYWYETCPTCLNKGFIEENAKPLHCASMSSGERYRYFETLKEALIFALREEQNASI